jgi:hypothetical protein
MNKHLDVWFQLHLEKKSLTQISSQINEETTDLGVESKGKGTGELPSCDMLSPITFLVSEPHLYPGGSALLLDALWDLVTFSFPA